MPEAMPLALESSVREVQVFREGAVVTRLATVPPGETVLALGGLPLCIDDESVRVTVVVDAGAAPRPVDVRAELVVPPLGSLLAPPSEEEVRAVERKIAEVHARAEVLDAELRQVDRLAVGLPTWDGKEPPRAASATTWNGLLDWTAKLRLTRLEEREALAVELKQAKEEQARLRRREAEARAKRDARADAVSKRVVLRLSGEPLARAATLRLEYRVPGAWWVPTYVLRLARDGRTARLGVRAHVAQRTGEPWDRVRLFLSTADLLRETELPELRSLRIGRRQPAPLKRAWREPPVAGEALLEGLKRAVAQARELPASSTPVAQQTVVLYDAFESEEELDLDDVLVGRGGAPSDPFPGTDPFGAPEGAMSMAFGGPPGASGRRASFDDGSSAGESFDALPAPAPPPAAKSMAPAPARSAPATGAMKRSAAPAKDELRRERGAFTGGAPGGGGAPQNAPAEQPPEGLAPDASFLRYGDLAMPRWDDTRFGAGKLRAVTWDDRLADLEPRQRGAVLKRVNAARASAKQVRSLPLPPLSTRVETSSGAFDHRYDTEGLVDVPSDGGLHNVPLLTAEAPVRATLVVVPRESDQAVRMATLTNPLEAPLLAGSAEVYLEDEFLVTAPLRTVPVGGELTVGLGVEPALKVARNTFLDEESTGLLGGGLSLKHRIHVELASRLATAVDVEVRELVPVKHDAEQTIEVIDETASPAWEKLREQEGGRPLQGGRRWRVTLKPGEEKKLVGSYTLKLDAKNEVVGGNRRT